MIKHLNPHLLAQSFLQDTPGGPEQEMIDRMAHYLLWIVKSPLLDSGCFPLSPLTV